MKKGIEMPSQSAVNAKVVADGIGSPLSAQRRVKFIVALALAHGVTPIEASLMCVEHALQKDVFDLGEILDIVGAR